MSEERGYRINANGEQTQFVYPVETEKTAKFDRDWLKNKYLEIMKTSDDISSKIDNIVVYDCVDFEPKFDINEDFEDIYARS